MRFQATDGKGPIEAVKLGFTDCLLAHKIPTKASHHSQLRPTRPWKVIQVYVEETVRSERKKLEHMPQNKKYLPFLKFTDFPKMNSAFLL